MRAQRCQGGAGGITLRVRVRTGPAPKRPRQGGDSTGSSWIVRLAVLWAVVTGLLSLASCSDDRTVTSGGDDRNDGTMNIQSLEVEPGTWRTMPPAPLRPRWDPETLWNGTAVIVWGGSASLYEALLDGAMFDPDNSAWTPIPAAPLPDRRGTAFWVDDRLVAWIDAFRPTLSRGAAYSPSDGVWNPIAPQPTELEAPSPIAVATEDAVFVTSQGVEPGATRSMAAYDPAVDAWHMLPPPPPTDEPVHLMEHSGEILLLGCDGAYGAAYDPDIGTWRDAVPPPVGAATCIASPPSFPSTLDADGTIVTWPWRDAPRFRHDADGDGDPDQGPPQPGARFEPATRKWRPISPSPSELPARGVAAGDRILVWGGGTFPDPPCDDSEQLETTDLGLSYSLGDDRWRRLEAGPLSPRNGHAIAWTGQALFVWGGASSTPAPGCELYEDGALWTPSSG